MVKPCPNLGVPDEYENRFKGQIQTHIFLSIVICTSLSTFDVLKVNDCCKMIFKVYIKNLVLN